jgi:hypothetical protein
MAVGSIVGLTPVVGFCSTTFFCARKNASYFSLSGAKKRQFTAGVLYAGFLVEYKIGKTA